MFLSSNHVTLKYFMCLQRKRSPKLCIIRRLVTLYDTVYILPWPLVLVLVVSWVSVWFWILNVFVFLNFVTFATIKVPPPKKVQKVPSKVLCVSHVKVQDPP